MPGVMSTSTGHSDFSQLSIGQCAALALVWEATAQKPGNVHRGADFEDLVYPDFLTVAALTAPVYEAARGRPLGDAVLEAVRQARLATGSNVNLGSALLLAPLAAAPRERPLAAAVRETLAGLTPKDSQNIYEAIRLAAPGGLGVADEHDVAGPAPDDLIAAMRAAADRDLVAAQYANGFADVLEFVAPALQRALAAGLGLNDAIVHVHLQVMSQYPDSLIARKCGVEAARVAASRAAKALAGGAPGSDAYFDAVADLDFWLRSAGHRRNPGTTADLLAAGLFALLRDGIIKAPFRW
jgi:triphosphoribosyl-dephospho-CoA synthase